MYNLLKIDFRSFLIHFQRLFVSSSYRGSGLAQRLLDDAFKYVEEQQEKNIFVSKISVFINALQKSACKIYEHNGFELSNQWELPIFIGLSYTTLCFYEKQFGTKH